MIVLTKFALPHMKRGSTIVNSASVTAYKGSAGMLDCKLLVRTLSLKKLADLLWFILEDSATKGASKCQAYV